MAVAVASARIGDQGTGPSIGADAQRPGLGLVPGLGVFGFCLDQDGQVRARLSPVDYDLDGLGHGFV
jgi:hypothetical protein